MMTFLRVIAVLCWLTSVIISLLIGNYIVAIILSVNLILGLLTLEANDRPVRRFVGYLVDAYHHRQSIKARRKRYFLFRHRAKHGPVEFEDEAKVASK